MHKHSNLIIMYNLILEVKNKKELDFVSNLLKKIKIKNKVFTIEEMEDMGLIHLMKQADRSQKVSREKIMAKLGK